MKILVTGAKGQLGSELKAIAGNYRAYAFTFADVEEMDLASDDSIDRFFEGKEFDFIIHCAAYTAVDQAEKESALAFRINAGAVEKIASICKSRSIRLIHISTDYVFDGAGNQPIAPDAIPSPLSVYGKSKLEGEQQVLRLLKDAYIIRTAWVYSTYGKNFVKTIARLAKEKPSLGVVADQIGSPTYAADLADTILQIIKKIETREVDQPGIYHYTNEGVISWYDLAYFIVDYYKLACQVNPITTEEYPTLATRPAFSVLDKRSIKKTFGVRIPHWHESLRRCLERLES